MTIAQVYAKLGWLLGGTPCDRVILTLMVR
jgi:hypothetical protein